MKIRKTLSFSGLVNVIRKVFVQAGKKEKSPGKISLDDCLMSAFAMFSLKYCSLLRFDKDSRGENEVLVNNLI